MSAKLVSAADAVAAIPDNITLGIAGFVGTHPEALSVALEQRFLETGSPKNLTLVYAAGQGDGKERGMNHLAHAGLIKRVVGGHWNLAPRLGKMALENAIEAYNFPQGVMCALFREIAAKRPGVFTKVGLNTFIDPANGGGKLNARSTEDLVERIELRGETWLWYRSFPVHVTLLRGSVADRHGNISMEDEAYLGEGLPMAQAARNNGGIVIAQVKKIVDYFPDPKSVHIPGILVDKVVLADTDLHWQTYGEVFNPAYIRHTPEKVEIPAMPFSERKIIGRRVLNEIPSGAIVNLGIGVPEAVASVASEKGKLSDFTLTLESGPIGGAPAGGLSFGCSANLEAVIDQPSMFDYYDGGGIDFSALGAVEIDEEGSVCVSTMGTRFAGVGGFVNISASAKTIAFCCPLRAGGLTVDFDGTSLRIAAEGKHRKFVKKVAQVCFHGPSGFHRGQRVLYVTERAVFQLTEKGLELIEIAPGIDLETQVLALMDFRPKVSPSLRIMPVECFSKS